MPGSKFASQQLRMLVGMQPAAVSWLDAWSRRQRLLLVLGTRSCHAVAAVVGIHDVGVRQQRQQKQHQQRTLCWQVSRLWGSSNGCFAA